jgi:hypothetical protein
MMQNLSRKAAGLMAGAAEYNKKSREPSLRAESLSPNNKL